MRDGHGIRAALAVAVFAVVLGESRAVEGKSWRFSCVFTAAELETLRTGFVVDQLGNAVAVARNVYPARVVVGSEAVTFLEELATGAVQSTTIRTTGEAVHCRHTIMAGKLIANQYLGKCERHEQP